MGSRRGEVDQLEVTQGFEAVALGIHLALLDGHVAQLGPSLDIEEEHQPINNAQAFQAELTGFDGIFAGVKSLLAGLGLLTELSHGFIAQEFYGFAEGILEVFADAERVLVGVFIEAIQQAGAGIGGQAFAVQQCRCRLKGVGVLAVEDLIPIEAQQTVVGPLVAIEQQPLFEPDEEDEARGVVGSENRLGNQLQPRCLFQQRRHFLTSVMEGLKGVVERVFVFVVWCVGRDDEQPGSLMGFAQDRPNRNRHVGLQQHDIRLQRIAQGSQERLVQALVGYPPFGRFTEASVGGQPGKPLATEACEPSMGGSGGGTFGVGGCGGGGLFSGLPAFDLGADVAIENLGEVVVAVEFVLVGDSYEALDGLCDRHGGRGFVRFSGQPQRGLGGRAEARWSWCLAPIGDTHQRPGGFVGSVVRVGCA